MRELKPPRPASRKAEKQLAERLRREQREWRRLATPEQREKFLAASREWYAGLSAEERARLIAGKVEKRRQRRAGALGSGW